MSGNDHRIVRKRLEVGDQDSTDDALLYAAADDFKDGVYAGIGLIHARQKLGDLAFEVNGPVAGIGIEGNGDKARVMVKAEAAKASYSVGPVKAGVHVGADTGFEVGKSGVEAKVLGTGFSFGRKMGLSLFGFGFEIEK